ncbi:LacI family DNA-binding transcriptional regulator [Mucilaginibacter sp. AW1-3]
MKRKVTLKDIAAELGISQTTVSFIINGKARENHIRPDLEQRVLEHVDRVGYRPNHLAQILRTGKTKIIGMLMEDISDPFFSSISRIIEEIAFAKGYKIFFCSTENDPDKTRELLKAYRDREVDGYIIAPPPGIEAELKGLAEDGYPVILFDRTLPGLRLDNVLVDNYQGTFNVVRHFIDNGYKNIAMITLDSGQGQMMERQKGYLAAIAGNAQGPLIKMIRYPHLRSDSILEIKEFISGNRQVDALFFATNYIADNGLEAIRDLGLNISMDIGVAVFDDHDLYRLFTPSVTAVAQPVKLIAEQIIDRILQKLAGELVPDDVRSFVLPTRLVVRDSSLPKVVELSGVVPGTYQPGTDK